MTLDEIAIKHGTDKATIHPLIQGHGYTPHYEKFFEPWRELPVNLLEIGVGGGESIRTWLEYFPKAWIFGVDIIQNTNPWNTKGSGADPRYTFTHVDQSSDLNWLCFLADHGHGWDIIIDDGSHYCADVLTSYNRLWMMLNSRGLYCIEDLAVAYGGAPFTVPGKPTHMDFVKGLLDEINQLDRIRSLHFSKELVIIEKV